MKNRITEESCALVYKCANRFAHGTNSIKYDLFLNAGFDGLKKANDTYKENCGVKFSTYAYTCIKNKMCTSQQIQNRFTLQQDENIDVEAKSNGKLNEMLADLICETQDGNIFDFAKDTFFKVNNGNKRNTDICLFHIGIGCEKPMDYQELGKVFELHPERCRQIFKKSVEMIKKDPIATELLYSFAA